MSEIADYLGTLTANPVSFIVSAVVFVAVFGAVFVAGLHLLSPRKSDRAGLPPSLRSQSSANRASRSTSAALLNQLSVEPAASTQDQTTQGLAAGAGFNPKRTLLAIHKILSALVMLGLITITIGIYFATEPGDGSRLAFWVFAAATALAGMHLHSAAQRHRSAEEDASSGAHFRHSVQTILSDKIAAALLSQGQVQWEVASPEVRSIDQETLDRARRMAAAGTSMDEICRAIEPSYDQWTAPHQQAYQNVVRAALEHGG